MQLVHAPCRDGIPLRADVDRIDPESQRFYKVRKHLMDPLQCWHLVCAGLPPDPRDEAMRAGCSVHCLRKDVYQFERVSEGCRRHVLGAHDLHFEPAYWRAFDSAVKSGHLAFAFEKKHEALAAGDEGVFVVLSRGRGSGRWRVMTAYRPVPRRQDGPPGKNSSFSNAARRKWLHKTTQPAKARMRVSPTWSDPLAEELGALLDRIERERLDALDVHDAARVLVLLARAGQPGSSTSLEALLRRGLPHLPGLAALAPPEEVKPLLTELAAACQEGDDPLGVLHDVLLDLDDWLSVAVFLEQHGVPLPAAASAAARDEAVRFAATCLARAPEQAAPLADWALARVGSLEPKSGASGGEPHAQVMALWQAVVHAPATVHPAPRPTGSLEARLRRILDSVSLARVIPRDAFASSGIDLGPEPVELHRWGDAKLELSIGPDLQTPVLQVSRTQGDEAPWGTRDGTPLTFTRDEFQAWLAEARPGLHQVSLRGETVEFTLTTP